MQRGTSATVGTRRKQKDCSADTSPRGIPKRALVLTPGGRSEINIESNERVPKVEAEPGIYSKLRGSYTVSLNGSLPLLGFVGINISKRRCRTHKLIARLPPIPGKKSTENPFRQDVRSDSVNFCTGSQTSA